MNEFRCFYCGAPIDPTARETWHRIEAWERKGLGSSRRGGSDVALREARDEFAHTACIRIRQGGGLVGQESLFA